MGLSRSRVPSYPAPTRSLLATSTTAASLACPGRPERLAAPADLVVALIALALERAAELDPSVKHFRGLPVVDEAPPWEHHLDWSCDRTTHV